MSTPGFLSTFFPFSFVGRSFVVCLLVKILQNPVNSQTWWDVVVQDLLLVCLRLRFPWRTWLDIFTAVLYHLLWTSLQETPKTSITFLSIWEVSFTSSDSTLSSILGQWLLCLLCAWENFIWYCPIRCFQYRCCIVTCNLARVLRWPLWMHLTGQYTKVQDAWYSYLQCNARFSQFGCSSICMF